ncbi:MAG: CRISPR-associated protein Csx19 [Candidatus Methanoperedens sp.]|nr:CRISPR-associated protein Csx19 [Candidatus Methanoperedens sp.]
MEMNNGLRLCTIKSHVLNFSNIELTDFNSLKSFMKINFGQKEALCVFYLDYKVLIGRYDGDDFRFYNNETFEPRFIQKMRLFDQNQELYIWRENKKNFRGRLRVDSDGDEIDVVDAKQVLWGTNSKSFGDFSEIFEERGTKIILPFKDLKIDKNENRAFILTRNYISYETYDSSYKQAGYGDCRFVAFTDKNGAYLEV